MGPVRDPLLAPAVALIAGVVASRLADLPAAHLGAATAALAALALFAIWKSTRRAACAAAITAIFFLGALIETIERPGPPPELDAAPRELVLLDGCVVEPPIFFEDREQFLLELEPGARVRVALYPRTGEEPPRLRYGQRVEVEARVRRTQSFRNPGSFDYASWLARRDVYWTASARAGSAVKPLAGECGSLLRRAIYSARTAALDRLDRLYRPDAFRTAMSRAVLIGDSSGLEKVWTEDFKRTGTYHALVISGLHITVVAGLLLFLFRLAWMPRGAALAAAALAAWAYAFVAGGEAPVTRAAAGFTFYVAAKFLFRRARVVNILSGVAILFVVIDAGQIFEASFQLSFLAVAAIGVFAAPLLERSSVPLGRGLAGLADVDRDPRLDPRAANLRVELRLLAEALEMWTRLPQRAWLAVLAVLSHVVLFVYELAVISVAVQIGLALPMIAYFHRLALTSISANLLVVPLTTWAVPVGFAAILTGLKLPAALAGWALAASRGAARWHGEWEPSWRIPEPPLWLACGFAAALIAAAWFDRRGSRRKLLAAWALSLALLAIIVRHPFPPRIEHGALEFTLLDVGQGESAFLAFPDGRTMVLDGGGMPASGRQGGRPRFDTGEDVVSPYLWSRSIRRLDVVAMSHAHEDHCGGLPALIENFSPAELWTGAVPDSPEWRRIRDAALARGVRIVHRRAGERFFYGGATVEVLAPPDDQVGQAPHNNDSLVLRLTRGQRSLLATGDIERKIEAGLLARGLARADVLKVAHHGSRTSTGEAFLDAVQPAFALISAGRDNQFGNPHAEVLARLADHGVLVLRTDLWGLVSVRTDGTAVEVGAFGWPGDSGRLF